MAFVPRSASYGWFDLLMQHKKKALIAAGFFVAITGAYVIYKRAALQQEQDAQKFFSECVEEYARVAEQKEGNWEAVERAFVVGYERYNKAALAPHFLAFQVEALVRQNKTTQALALMDKVVQEFSTSPLLNLYATKRSLMKIDSAEQAIQEAGLQELTQLANDTKNIYRDQAQFHLGLYFWTRDDIAQARTIWQPLTELAQTEKNTSSIWAQFAQMKLSQIS